jgi:hypothetical protein
MRTVIVAIVALLVTSAAFAQSTPTTVAPAQTAGPLVLEQIHDGWMLAPDVKVTSVDNRTGELVGAYGGRVFDGSLMIGGAGYWLANDRHDSKLAYGGVVVGWQSPEFGRIRFGARGLVGGGSGTLGIELPARVPIPPLGPGDIRFGNTDPRVTDPRATTPATGAPTAPTRPQPAPAIQSVRFVGRDDFFVVEPTASIGVRITSGIGLSCGIGYRQTTHGRFLGDRLSGPSANLSVQFGW